MKKLITLLSMLALMILAQAQEEKLRVAIFDPTSSGTTIDEGTKLAVQELISSTLVNTGKYTIVERSMIEKIMKEQAFQNSDMADNSQATEIGKLAGANKIVLSAVSLVGNRNMLSIKIIDVQTATIEQQKTKIVNTDNLLDAVEPLTLELLPELTDKIAAEQKIKEEKIAAEQQAELKKQEEKEAKDPLSNNVPKIVVDGRKFFINGQEITKEGVSEKMVNTDALRWFDKGVKQRKSGVIQMIIGGVFLAGGVSMIITPFIAGPESMFYDEDYSYVRNGYSSYKSFYYEKSIFFNLFLYNGIAILSTGSALLISGGVTYAKGQKNIKKAADNYNNSKLGKTAYIEWGLGATPNGMGFVLKF